MTESVQFRHSRSQEYEFEKDYEDCELEIALPGGVEPWMVMVKIGTIEGEVEAVNPSLGNFYSIR